MFYIVEGHRTAQELATKGGNPPLSVRTEIRVRQIRRRTRQYRLWYLDDELYYGAYASFTQKAVINADEMAYTIAAGRWPSGLEQIVYLQDEDAPTFHASSNGTDFTYHTADQLYWASSDENVIQLFTAGDSLSLADSPTVGIVAAGAACVGDPDRAGQPAVSQRRVHLLWLGAGAFRF